MLFKESGVGRMRNGSATVAGRAAKALEASRQAELSPEAGDLVAVEPGVAEEPEVVAAAEDAGDACQVVPRTWQLGQAAWTA
jgi:hypothetical protein